MVNPEYSSEKHSDVKLITDADHTSGTIEVKSDTMSYDNEKDYGLIVITR